MLGVAGLVKEGMPVVCPTDRLDDEDDAVRYLDRGAERPWALVRALLEIERDVVLRSQVDAEIGEGGLEGRQHPVAREHRIPLGCSKEPWQVVSLGLSEGDAYARAKELVRVRLVQPLGRVEECATLLGEVVERRRGKRLSVELEIRRKAEVASTLLHDLGRFEMQRIHPLVEDLVGAGVELTALVAVGLVRNRRPHHPEGNPLSVQLDLQLGLELGEALCVFARQIAEVPLAREAPELARA